MQITIRPVATDEKLTVRRQTRERNEDQLAIDKLLGETVMAYAENGAGKVAEEKRPRLRLAVAPEDRADLKAYLRRAANLFKVVPVFFEDTTDDSTGEAVVTLTVGPKPAKK